MSFVVEQYHVHVCNIFTIKKLVSNAGVYRVPDSVRFDQVQITGIPGPVPVHLWLNHTVTNVMNIVVQTSMFLV